MSFNQTIHISNSVLSSFFWQWSRSTTFLEVLPCGTQQLVTQQPKQPFTEDHKGHPGPSFPLPPGPPWLLCLQLLFNFPWLHSFPYFLQRLSLILYSFSLACCSLCLPVLKPEIIGQKLPFLLSITWLCLLLFWEEVIWEAVHASLCVCVWPPGLLFGDFYHLQFAKTPGWCKSVLTLLTNQIILKLTGQCSPSLDTTYTYIEDIFIPEYCDSFLL